MIRLVARATLNLLASAVALIVASLILDDMSLDVDGFIIALLIFSVTGVLIEPLLRQTAVRSAPALLGSTALISTLISLVVTALVSNGLTALVSNGLQISGFTTWILATILVWLIALAARFLLPFIIFRRTFEELRERRRD
jgi:putative membrane protein